MPCSHSPPKICIPTRPWIGVRKHAHVVGFGLASKIKRVGVFSIARYTLHGLTDPNQIAYNCCKVMVHESAHMFGLKHCLYYRCVMNGALSAAEEEKKPLCNFVRINSDRHVSSLCEEGSTCAELRYRVVPAKYCSLGENYQYSTICQRCRMVRQSLRTRCQS